MILTQCSNIGFKYYSNLFGERAISDALHTLGVHIADSDSRSDPSKRPVYLADSDRTHWRDRVACILQTARTK